MARWLGHEGYLGAGTRRRDGALAGGGEAAGGKEKGRCSGVVRHYFVNRMGPQRLGSIRASEGTSLTMLVFLLNQ